MNISKLQLSGTTYNIVDTTSGYATKTELTNAVTGATEIINGELDKKFGYASYNESNKHIEFKANESGAVLAYVDATDFIKDGMVDNVEVKDGKLVITFNTDSGKEDIEIEISKIFNAENYYDKTAADAKFGTKTEQESLRSDLEDALGEIASLESDLQGKQDKLDGAYMKQMSIGGASQESLSWFEKDFNTTNQAPKSIAFKTINGTPVIGGGKIELPTTSDIEGINKSLDAKADKSDTYTKEEVDKKVADSGTFDASQYYNKTEVNNLLAQKNQVISVEGDVLIIS